MSDRTIHLARSREGFLWTPENGYSHGLHTPAVVSSTPEYDLSSQYDVIVIGAGFAGLSAARDLYFAGKSVLLVEARDRIGGRTWTAYSKEGEMFEMGGAWVHWQQPHVFSELQRYGLDDFLETKALPKDCRAFFKPTIESPLIIQDPEEAAKTHTRMEKLMSKLLDTDGHGGRTVIPFPFNTSACIRSNPAYPEIDQLNIEERVNQLNELSEEDRLLLKEHAASFYGIPPDRAAFSEVLHTFALCNFQPEMIEEATMKYKISQGTTAFALAILDDFKGHRLFSSPVTRIAQTDELYGATVTLGSGIEYHSKVIVSTIPMNVILSTKMDPPLSPLRKEAFANGIIPSRIDKLLIKTSTDLPNGFNISCEGGDMPFASGFADGYQNGESLVTLLCQPNMDLDSSKSNLRLIETLHPNGLSLTSARAHLWSKDPYAGGVMPIRQAGFIQRYQEEVWSAHYRVHFCGSDFSDGWRGFISGAFESSYRVSRKVLACLRNQDEMLSNI